MPAHSREWLEPDGLGGFASGTVDGIRTRRYHALLLSAAPGTTASFARYALVNGVEARLELASGERIAITRQRYAPDVVAPPEASLPISFTRVPWPRWVHHIGDGGGAAELAVEIVGVHGAPVVAVTWRATTRTDGSPLQGARLVVRPLLSGRDLHSTHHVNDAFRFDADGGGGLWMWHPYDAVPRIVALTNGSYRHDPVWYRDFQYDEERARGLDYLEDLASPGEFTFDLGAGEAMLLVAAASPAADEL
ncbi:MAG: glycogen debranching enzyme N-terminal domain-containing protein, partial [Gemmatimonadaceae bacterium]